VSAYANDLKYPQKNPAYARFVEIASSRWIDSAAMSRELGVTPRTVWRYIATAKACGLPIQTHNGAGGGMRIRA